MRRFLPFTFLTAAMLVPQQAAAQVAAADSGDTGWMIFCALLVLIAALPGLALRHAGLINVRNSLSVTVQGLAVAAAVSLLWAVAGYSLAFAPDGYGWLGGGGNVMLANLGALRDSLTVPESAFVLFQMSLAIFAACLLVGALAERARFGWIVAFAPLWLLLVYAPVTHWVWGGGWLAELGVLDFAGGVVIHISAGFSALALALLMGRRREASEPGHAPLLTLAGGGLIWVGWFGIVGGWALGASDDAASAILNCHFAACAAALMRALLDRLLSGRVSATGLFSGALSGLVAISASAGLVGVGGAIVIGVIAAVVCRLGAAMLDGRIDDPAGVFAIHGLGGLTGMLLLPVFTLSLFGGVGFDPGMGFDHVLLSQGIGMAVVAFWSMLGTAIAALIVMVVIPMRVSEQDEASGLDAVQHGQQGWDFR